MEAIPLAALLPAGLDPAECKLHCAVFNGERHPIEVLATSWDEWQGWNSWRNVNDDFNRRYVFSLAQDRHDPTLWLFGGVWEVVGRRPEPRAASYDVVFRADLMGAFVRRLYVRLALAGRNRRRNMETLLGDMTVASIAEEEFAGDPFPGHDRIDHSLAELQVIVGQRRADWRIALESMKGVYVIHDQVTGARYVGSAYGDTGVVVLRPDPARRQRRAAGAPGGAREGVLPGEHAVRTAGVLVDANVRRACARARVVLEERAARAVAGAQPELTPVCSAQLD